MRLPLSLFSRIAPAMTYELIRKQISGSVPFATHNGVEVTKIEKGHGVARLMFRPEGLNHIGTQHAGALFAVGEAASGAAMAGAFAPILLDIRPVAADAMIRYLNVAKGAVVADARIDGDTDAILNTVKTDGKAKFRVVVALSGEDDGKVAEMSVDWHVSMKRN